MNVGFIGLGKMGSPMARNLLDAGHTLTVHDVVEATTTQHRELGAKWAQNPKEVAMASDVIFTSLQGPSEIESVVLGAEGLIEGIRPDSIYVDLSTGSPTSIQALAKRMESRGTQVIDAPVSGGVLGAEKGTLAIMVGGESEAVEKVHGLLELLGTSILHVGGIGSGTVAKLAHNAISMTARIVIQEGMALAAKAGVSPRIMLEVLRDASFGKQLVLTSHIPEIVLTGEFDNPRFSLGLSHKDVGLALQLAKEVDVPMEMVETAEREIVRGMDRGWAGRDNLVTFLMAEERSGVRIRD